MSIKATSWVYDQPITPAGAKFVAVVIADHCNSEGYSYPSVTRIIEMTGMGESTVREHTATLEATGIIKKSPRFGKRGEQKSSGYWLLMPGVNPDADDGEPSNIQTPPPSNIQTPPLRKSSSPPLRNSEAHIIEPSLEPSLEPPLPQVVETEFNSDSLAASQELEHQNHSDFVEDPTAQTESTQTQVQNPIAPAAEFSIAEFDVRVDTSFLYSSVEKILENRPACFAERDGLYLHCKNLLPNLEDKTFFRLFNILCSPAQFSYNRKNYKQAFLRLEFWLTELQPKFIDEVLNIARDGENRTSNGYAMWMLNNPADACQKHPELEPLRRASGSPARVIPKIVKLKPIDEQVFKSGEAWG